MSKIFEKLRKTRRAAKLTIAGEDLWCRSIDLGELETIDRVCKIDETLPADSMELGLQRSNAVNRRLAMLAGFGLCESENAEPCLPRNDGEDHTAWADRIYSDLHFAIPLETLREINEFINSLGRRVKWDAVVKN